MTTTLTLPEAREALALCIREQNTIERAYRYGQGDRAALLVADLATDHARKIYLAALLPDREARQLATV